MKSTLIGSVVLAAGLAVASPAMAHWCPPGGSSSGGWSSSTSGGSSSSTSSSSSSSGGWSSSTSGGSSTSSSSGGTAVPEPGMLGLSGLALAGLIVARRRRTAVASVA